MDCVSREIDADVASVSAFTIDSPAVTGAIGMESGHTPDDSVIGDKVGLKEGLGVEAWSAGIVSVDSF